MRIERVGPHALVLGSNEDFEHGGTPEVRYFLEALGVKPDLSNLSLVFDPPYGIPIMTEMANVQRSKAAAATGRNFKAVHGNDEEWNPEPWLYGRDQLFWGGNHFGHLLPHNGRTLVWDKRCNIIPPRCQADCEIAWCSEYGAARVFYHYWDGMVKQSEMGQPREHPTQKPVELMSWCLHFAKGTHVMDAYMGSGTTGVAAVKAGRTFIGIEIEAEYFEVALRRIREAYAQPDLFHNPQGEKHEPFKCKTAALS